MAPVGGLDANVEGFPRWLVSAIIIGILLFFGTIVALRLLVVRKGLCCFSPRRDEPPSRPRYPLSAPYRRPGVYATAQLKSMALNDDLRSSYDSLASPPPPYAPSPSTHSRSPTAQLPITSPGYAAQDSVPRSPPFPPPAYLGRGTQVVPMAGVSTYRAA